MVAPGQQEIAIGEGGGPQHDVRQGSYGQSYRPIRTAPRYTLRGPSSLQGRTMSSLSRSELRALMATVLAAQDKKLPDDDATALRDIGFRSLDFSELALRVEDEIGRELNFDAPGLRQVATVGDVLEFLDQLQRA